MARRKARIPQGKKLQPAVKTLTFNFQQGGEGGGFDYIDLSQCASLVNRRFYRQGLNWAVAGFTFITTGGSGNIFVQKIPDTWVASNSWHKGFAAWNDMQQKALEDAESIKPKFNDFKVYMDAAHHQAGVGSNLIPIDEAGNPATVGTWDMSNMIIPDDTVVGNTRDREIIWTGANYPGAAPASGLNAVSLIEGYAASRGLPDIRDPNAPTDAGDAEGVTPQNWIGALDNEGIDQDAEVLQDMLTENTKAPYPFENDGTHTDTQYPGGANQLPGVETHDVVGVSATTVGNVTKMSGSNFQGGLIKIFNNLVGGSGNQVLLVHLVPGPHRGYMCQAMQDV
jgi:hypothetical protein